MQHHIRHWSIDYILFLLFISSLTTTISLGLFPQHQSSAFLRRISNTCTTHNFRHTNYLLQHDFNLFPHTHNNNQCSHLTFQCTKGTTEPQLILSYFCFFFFFLLIFSQLGFQPINNNTQPLPCNVCMKNMNIISTELHMSNLHYLPLRVFWSNFCATMLCI